MTYEDAFIPFVTRHVIAVGMAIGMFFGLIPLCGLKTLPAIGITRLLRGSIVGAAIGVTLHDIILPVVPLLLGWEYDVGYWLLSHPHELPPRLRLSHQSPAILVPLAHVLTVGFRCHSTRWWWRPGWRRDVLPHAYLRDDLWLRMGLAVTESKTDFPRCAGPASI